MSVAPHVAFVCLLAAYAPAAGAAGPEVHRIAAGRRPIDHAVEQAFDLLTRYGRLHGPLPQVSVVEPSDFPDQPTVRLLRGFRVERAGVLDEVIYLVETNTVYRLARRGNEQGITLLASTILHEIVHGDGGDERAAIRAEIQFLRKYVLTERGNSDPLMWEVRALENRLKVPGLASTDALRPATPTNRN